MLWVMQQEALDYVIGMNSVFIKIREGMRRLEREGSCDVSFRCKFHELYWT